MGRWIGVLLLVGVIVGAPASAVAQDAPFVPSTDMLPPVAADEPSPDYAQVCGELGLTCFDHVEQELADWEDRFGCDHRAVFPTVYRLLTHRLATTIQDDHEFFDDPAGVGFEALAFYELFEQMITDHLAGREIPPAWQVAMEAANEGDWTGGHDMLLAINAHVQRDMPFAMARVGLVLPDGTSRKPDHDAGNRVLAEAYGPITREIGRRYDPMMSDVESLPVADDVGAAQLVAGWREGVWRNAESLVTTDSSDASVAAIETNAHAWAETIRTGEVPGRREMRDAYCRQVLAAEQDQEAAQEGDGAAYPPTPTSPPSSAPPTVAAPQVAGPTLPATGGGLGVGALLALGAVGMGRRRR